MEGSIMHDPFAHIKDQQARPPVALWLAAGFLLLAVVLSLWQVDLVITSPLLVIALLAAITAFVRRRTVVSSTILIACLIATPLFSYLLPISRISRAAQRSQSQSLNNFKQVLEENLNTYGIDLGLPGFEEEAYKDRVILSDISASYIDTASQGQVPGIQLTLHNDGNHTLEAVKLNAYFMDKNNKTVHLESFYAFNPYSDSITKLAAGERFSTPADRFFTFTAVPSSWQEGNISLEVDAVVFQ
jgi:hypothetical protein